MTTKKLVRGFILTVALCLSATAGRAQDKRLFLMAGGSSLDDFRSFSEFDIPYSTEYATGGIGTVGIEVPLKKSKVFGLEGSYGFGQNNLRLRDLNVSPVTITSYGMRINRVSADLVARPQMTYRSARPYVVFGVEYDRFSPTSRASTLATTEGFAAEPTAKLGSQSSGGVNFGGGLDFRAASRVGLRIDVRYHIIGSNTFGLPTSEPSSSTPSGGPPWFPVTGHAHDIVYSIGIVYRFGREKPSPAPSESNAPSESPAPRSSRHPSPSNMPSSPPSPF
jgi:opacity protein-like surface antigen